MTLEELKTECQTQGYQPNRATVLKLLEIIDVLSKGCAEGNTIWALDRVEELERRL